MLMVLLGIMVSQFMLLLAVGVADASKRLVQAVGVVLIWR
jgi:hypothetical protein